MCSIQHLLRGEIDIVNGIYPGIKGDAAINGQGMHHGIQSLQQQIHIHQILWQQQGEGISRKVGGNTPLANNGVEIGGGGFENNISRFHIKQLVNQLEAGYVQIDDIVSGMAVIIDNGGQLLEKGVLGKQAC